MTAPRRDGYEEPWRAWIRRHKDLDSVRAGLAVTDSDMWFHLYLSKTDSVGTREVQHIMLTEWKTYGAGIGASQADTLQVVDAVLRTTGSRFIKVPLRGGWRNVRSWGVHTVSLSSADPACSEWILWDNKPISEATLVQLLTFKRNPDTLQERSDRRHHTPSREKLLQPRLRIMRHEESVDR
jgi:hypothetical protein